MDERRTVKALEIAPAWTALQLSTPNGVTDSTLLAVQSQLDLFCMIHCSSHASATLHSGAPGPSRVCDLEPSGRCGQPVVRLPSLGGSGLL